MIERSAEYPFRWAAVCPGGLFVAFKIGCSAPTLHELVKRSEVDRGVRAGVPANVAD